MTIFIDNKYTKWYNSLIEKRRRELVLDGYYEIHHVIPKCLGGTDDKENLISLTAREHVVAHWLLTKMVDSNHRYKMLFAFNMMTQVSEDQERRLTPLEASKAKQAKIKAYKEYHSSPEWPNRWQEIKPKWEEAMREVNSRPEVKAKRSSSQKVAQNRPDVVDKRKQRHSDPEFKKKQSAIAKEVANRPEMKEKASKRNLEVRQRPGMPEKYRLAAIECQNRPEVKAMKSAMLREKKKCPHCDKIGNPLAMRRWHFDNCKMLKKEEEV